MLTMRVARGLGVLRLAMLRNENDAAEISWAASLYETIDSGSVIVCLFRMGCIAGVGLRECGAEDENGTNF